MKCLPQSKLVTSSTSPPRSPIRQRVGNPISDLSSNPERCSDDTFEVDVAVDFPRLWVDLDTGLGANQREAYSQTYQKVCQSKVIPVKRERSIRSGDHFAPNTRIAWVYIT